MKQKLLASVGWATLLIALIAPATSLRVSEGFWRTFGFSHLQVAARNARASRWLSRAGSS